MPRPHPKPALDDGEGEGEQASLTHTHAVAEATPAGLAEVYPTYTSTFRPLFGMAWPVLCTYVCNFIVPVASVSGL